MCINALIPLMSPVVSNTSSTMESLVVELFMLSNRSRMATLQNVCFLSLRISICPYPLIKLQLIVANSIAIVDSLKWDSD